MSAQMPKRIYFRANGDANSYALIDADAIKWLMNVLVNGEHATARQAEILERMAACWNACDGMTTEALESAGNVCNGWKLASYSLNDAKAQREKLLQLLEHAKHLINISTGKRSKLRAMKVVDEAIANLTKEAP